MYVGIIVINKVNSHFMGFIWRIFTMPQVWAETNIKLKLMHLVLKHTPVHLDSINPYALVVVFDAIQTQQQYKHY